MRETMHLIQNIDSPEKLLNPKTIEAASQYVWAWTSARIDHAKDRRTSNEGRPGTLWYGSQTGVINDLFPELFSNMFDSDQRQEFRRLINRYLRDSGVMICRKRSARNIPAVWWVSDHWTDLKVTNVSAVEPDNEPDEDADEGEITGQDSRVAEFPCRICAKVFTLHHIRVAHERRDHSMIFHSDGTSEELPKGRITDKEIQDLVLLVAMEAKEPETLTYFFKQARVLDPRTPRLRVHGMVLNLAEDPDSPIVRADSFDQYPRFVYDAETPQERTEPSEEKSMGSPLDTAIGNMEDALQYLLEMREVQSDLLYLQEKIQELSDALDTATTERDTAISERDTAIKEAADLRRLLDTIRNQIMGNKE